MKVIKPTGEVVYQDNELVIESDKDKLHLTHVRDIEPIFAKTAEARKLNNNGFSKGRNFRYLGTIPLMTLLNNPELADDAKLKKYLRDHPRCRAVAPNTF